jgi:hypothetical protein
VTDVLADLLGPKSGRDAAGRTTIQGVRIELGRSARELGALVKGSFAPIFVIGNAEHPFSEPVATISGLTLFAAETWPTLRPDRWLDAPLNRAQLEGLALVQGESLMVASNLIDLRGRPSNIDLWRARLERLAWLARNLSAPVQVDSGFDDLIARGVNRSFVERWAISDDTDRAEAIEQASDAQLAAALEEMARSWPKLMPLVQGSERDAPGADIARILVEAAEEIEIERGRRERFP